MRARNTLTNQQRESAVELFESGHASNAVARRLGVQRQPVERLYDRWRLHGRLCLVQRPSKLQFSFEVKKEAVNRFVAGETYMEIAAAFALSSSNLARTWVRQWRAGGDEALKPKPKGRPQGAAKPAQLTEEEKLRRENRRLQAENGYLKKIAGSQELRTRLKVEAISILTSDHDLTDLLHAAELARSTYYYHRARLNTPDKHARLKAEITRLFDGHKRRFGYRRIHLVLRRQGRAAPKKLVWKLMAQLGLQSKVRRKRAYSSYRGTVSHIADITLDREFQTGLPNTKWVSDVTEFRVAGRKVYLSPIYDLCDHSILSYTTATSPTTKFTAQSLQEALAIHNPQQGLLVHTDQGFHYQHGSWTSQLVAHHAEQSMSRKGNCFDNAVLENFFGHLKAEMYHGEHFATVDDFLHELDDYMGYYNTQRVQEGLEGMTPTEYRNHALEQQTA